MKIDSNFDQCKIPQMKTLMIRMGEEDSLISFEEALQSKEVQKTIRLWEQDDVLFAFSYVDDYFNLQYVIAPDFISSALEDEIIAWGISCASDRNSRLKENHTLDFSCEGNDKRKISLFLRHGFIQEELRSLDFSRSLLTLLPVFPIPNGFLIRPVHGEGEVEELVDLHRAAFGTKNMTVEQRLAIMRTPQYIPDLDLVVEHESGKLASFCIFEMNISFDGRKIGYPDPIGTHPDFQRHGLASALLSYGTQRLKERSAVEAKSGTSSTNYSMQGLFMKMGFLQIAEHIWFSKVIKQT